jgi:hypothetical protein
MVVSRFCKAINFCNSAFTLYALLKRSGLNMMVPMAYGSSHIQRVRRKRRI